MNIFRLHWFCIRAFFAFVTISLTVFSAPAQAQYVYVEPTQYLQVDSIWGGISRPASAEIGCQSIAEGYTKVAGPPYIGRVQKLTHPSPTYWGCYLDRSYGDGIWYHDADPDGAIRLHIECQPGFVFDTSIINSDGSTHLRCRGLASYQIEIGLTGPFEVRPGSTGGNATVDLTAKVAQGGNPKAGVVVSFSVDVISSSGGHEHNDPTRPKGTLSGTQGTTDANGEVQVTFKAPEIAGIHTIKATCATCSNSPATKEIQVKVPGLVEMQPDPQAPPSYTLVGERPNHPSNHWFLPDSLATLNKVVDAMFKTGWGTVGVNDGSLVWGGLFDIKSTWAPSHHEHRNGNEVDVSVNNPQRITAEQKKKTYAELCKKDNAAFSLQTLWHQDDGYPEHFHMYLNGSGLTSAAKGGPCCAHYKTTQGKKDKSGNPVLDKSGNPVQETVALCQETSPR
jgi:hypothetical protein